MIPWQKQTDLMDTVSDFLKATVGLYTVVASCMIVLTVLTVINTIIFWVQ